jgi:hypothetical protein
LHHKPKTKKLKQRKKKHANKNKMIFLKKLLEKNASWQFSMIPNACKKEYKGVVQDPSTNSNTRITIARKERSNAKKEQ